MKSFAESDGRQKAPTLDLLDLRILHLLVKDARRSTRALAREVGMSPPTVAERISRLERAGVIRGYTANIDPSALRAPLVVHIGAVAVQGVDQRDVVRQLRELVEVEDALIVTGRQDMIIRLRLRDTEHLRECLFEHIWSIEGLHRTETYISLDEMEPKNFLAGLTAAMLNETAIDGIEAGGEEEKR